VSSGRLITFEGIEGSGKSTQLELLANHLASQGVTLITTREPGGTSLGEHLRDVLLDPRERPVPLAELFLLEAARAQLVARVISPALDAGKVVLADRFADSSLAYQGGGRGLSDAAVATLNSLACEDLEPHRTLVLDLPVEVALARARHRPSTTADNRRFEDEALAFHRRVAEAYLRLARCHPDRVRIVNASGTREEVHERVLAALAGALP
jgi:dTMP kinase